MISCVYTTHSDYNYRGYHLPRNMAYSFLRLHHSQWQILRRWNMTVPVLYIFIAGCLLWWACGNLYLTVIQAFINTAKEIYQKIQDGVLDVTNEVRCYLGLVFGIAYFQWDNVYYVGQWSQSRSTVTDWRAKSLRKSWSNETHSRGRLPQKSIWMVWLSKNWPRQAQNTHSQP